MPKLILTSSFSTVAQELYKKGILPDKPLRVAFIPTAGDFYESKPWMEADRKALTDLGYSVFDVDLKVKTAQDLKEELMSSDIIFVAGGNTTYLVECVHASGFDSVIRDLIYDGRLYIGSSAGSILAGPSVEPYVEVEMPELPKEFVLHDPKGFGLVDYIILPHYPRFSETNDKVAKKYANRFTFVKMTDQEYRIES